MDESALFLKFWRNEAATTRKVISRIPDGSDYRPDPKSRTAREIAWLIAREEIVLAESLEKSAFEWIEVPAPPTMQEVLDTYDRHHDDVTARIERLDASKYAAKVPFLVNGQPVMETTGAEMMWGFLFDIVHHRGQLTTYLRPMGSTVPQIYGPSADEPM